MLKLGINIDHIATIRQARYRESGPGHPLAEPSPLQGALDAVQAGAHSVTAHLREDRRHIQDTDVLELKARLSVPLNLEMAVTPAMIEFACKLQPEEACLVPESRQEVTTEGGLDVVSSFENIKDACQKLAEAGIRVSLFIDPEEAQIEASSLCGAPSIELHTGSFANALDPDVNAAELERLKKAATLAHDSGLQVNAGHGLNYQNLTQFLTTPHLDTLNIGHSIISRSVSCGISKAVMDMLELMKAYRA